MKLAKDERMEREKRIPEATVVVVVMVTSDDDDDCVRRQLWCVLIDSFDSLDGSTVRPLYAPN
jgi:hypothetical protein